ncbi:HD-GYP domain-containing protein [Amphibacillus cookii]|uniref:HD-GYP domain-containing protein n=1 Tax=Amphibacillus cookii TaxID=767787 RepID=UPI00195E16A4|nr:HD domain-containing phosphohydrolase [Amphibacillus cookii]MBM7541371.1 HD-GYP domain-containing protein (c-di-GMP phosphodiesterase class II) [Amphibacillus cookii]
MFVHPNQLVPNCVIKTDVYGKTNYPIMLQGTIVTDMHIKVLNRFLVTHVEVSPKLANGQPFQPDQDFTDKEEQHKVEHDQLQHSTFLEQYQRAVADYQQMFQQWQNGTMIDIHQVRQMIVPLLEHIDHNHADIFLIANQSTKLSYFYHHSVSMSLLTAILAKRLGFDKESIQISIAALLADSGMAKLNKTHFEKNGKLPTHDYQQIKKHPTYSYRYLEKTPTLTKAVKLAVLQHHERIDSHGYPLGVPGEKIHPYAKIIAIADAYHAMTADRYYQEKCLFFSVISTMKKQENQQFDRRYLNVFITSLEDALLGEKVYLSDGRIGTLVALEYEDLPEIMIQLTETNQIISIGERDQLMINHLIK